MIAAFWESPKFNCNNKWFLGPIFTNIEPNGGKRWPKHICVLSALTYRFKMAVLSLKMITIRILIFVMTSSYCLEMPSARSDCSYDFSYPSDIIFLVDRTESIGNETFVAFKDFIKSFVMKAIRVGPDDVTHSYSQIAILTFSENVHFDIDFISKPSDIYACELFAPGGTFDKNVFFLPHQTDSTNKGIQDAIEEAQSLFEHGTKRRKRLFIISDFDTSMAANAKEALNGLKQSMTQNNYTLDAYGVGRGTYFNSTSMNIIFDSDHCAAMRLQDWDWIVQGLPILDKGTERPITDAALCYHLCRKTSNCSCYENSDLYKPYVSPRCMPTVASGQEGSLPAYAWYWILAAGCVAVPLFSTSEYLLQYVTSAGAVRLLMKLLD